MKTNVCKNSNCTCFLIWENWAHNQKCQLDVYLEPQSQENLQKIATKLAKKQNAQIRAIGSSHSWAPIFCVHCQNESLTTMISSKFLNQILSFNEDTGIVTCEAGVTLYQLGIFLQSKLWTLPNYPTPWELQIAGTTSTATHGSGDTGTLASFVTQIGLYTGKAKYIELSWNKKADRELFLTTNVGLGMTGTIYNVSLQCVPLRLFDQVTATLPATQVFKFFDEWIAQFDLEYFSFMWNWKPNTFSLTAYVDSSSKKKLPSFLKKNPATNRLSLFEQVMATGGGLRIEAEYAIPIFSSRNFTIQKLSTLLRPFLFRLDYQRPTVFIRFCNPDYNSYLSPTSIYLNGRFPTTKRPKSFLYTILRIDSIDVAKVTPFFRQVQSFFCLEHNGLYGNFHWGKFWSLNKKEFNRIYQGARYTFKKWQKNRNELDPKQKYWNETFYFFPS